MSVYRMEVNVGGRVGQLRIEITDLPGKENWQCMPDNIIGAHMGVVAWRGHQIGLFANSDLVTDASHSFPYIPPGVMAYAVLDIPEDGLDEVSIGDGAGINIASSGVGRWTLKEKLPRP